MKGSATIHFPPSSSQAVLEAVPGQLYIAADTADVSAEGHRTVIGAGSITLQLPFANGVVPSHTSTIGYCPPGSGTKDEL